MQFLLRETRSLVALLSCRANLFQVEDLAVASPATVSRAGMIFLDVDEMGWQPFVESWLHQRQVRPPLNVLLFEHRSRGSRQVWLRLTQSIYSNTEILLGFDGSRLLPRGCIQDHVCRPLVHV